MSFEQEENRAQQMNAMGFEYIVDADAQVLEDEPFVEMDVETDEDLSPDTESDVLHWQKPALVSKETLGTLARQFSFLLVPLPFAVLIFLFTLPATLQGPPAHPVPLVMAILLAALAILQGTLLYFAGDNDTFWLLSTVGGYALFVILGIGAAFGVSAAIFTLLALGLLGFIPMRRGIHPTRRGYVDIVESFGKYTHTLYPGLNLLMPWEVVAQRLSTLETTWTCPEQRVSISRDQFVRLTATISYQLLPEDAYLATLSAKDWENSLRVLFVGTLQNVVNQLSPADFVNWPQSVYTHTNNESSMFNPAAATRWDRINTKLGSLIQDQLATWGIQVNWVRIQDPTILPHTHIPDAQTLIMENGPTRVNRAEPFNRAEPPTVQIPPTERRPAPAHAAPQTAAPTSSAPPPPKTAAGKALRLETLVDAYDAVRQGVITDPATILEIAQRFEQLDSDPVASKAIDFDAGRAASTLRQRAQKFQERANASASNTRREA